MFNFEDRVALITGGTQGIGRQIAEDLYSLGAKIIITGKRSSFSDLDCEYHSVDFADRNQVNDLSKYISSLDRLDICINNAGINKVGPLEDSVEFIDNIVEVNLKAPYIISAAAVKVMKKSHYGRIVNIASIFGKISREGRSSYSSSKFGLRGMTVSSGIELAKHNILVNSVSPGFVLTALTKKILDADSLKSLEEAVPAQRLAEPKDISNVVVFLCSDMNTYIVGQDIVVDGGYVNV